jgi:hypothetical protein
MSISVSRILGSEQLVSGTATIRALAEVGADGIHHTSTPIERSVHYESSNTAGSKCPLLILRVSSS